MIRQRVVDRVDVRDRRSAPRTIRAPSASPSCAGRLTGARRVARRDRRRPRTTRRAASPESLSRSRSSRRRARPIGPCRFPVFVVTRRWYYHSRAWRTDSSALVSESIADGAHHDRRGPAAADQTHADARGRQAHGRRRGSRSRARTTGSSPSRSSTTAATCCCSIGMDDAKLVAIDIAMRKAKTAVFFQGETKASRRKSPRAAAPRCCRSTASCRSKAASRSSSTAKSSARSASAACQANRTRNARLRA